MKYAYFVVEGPHDIEFLGRLLSELGLRRIQLKRLLDTYWHDIIPKTFPIDDDLLKRVPVPVFFQNDTHSVAVHSATGDTRLVHTVQETLLVLANPLPSAIGLVLDSDKVIPEQRFGAICAALRNDTGLDVPTLPGEISSGTPRVGIFVLPDNQQLGTPEDILLECGKVSYPALLARAEEYVTGIDLTGLMDDERRDFELSAGRKKATVASVTNIMRPGKSIAVSIQDNQWLRGAALNLPNVMSVQQFVKQLLTVE